MWRYPEETKRIVRQRIANGERKIDVAIDMGIGYRTIIGWTLDMRRRTPRYSKETKITAVKRVLREKSKRSVSLSMKIPYTTLWKWTSDIETMPGNFSIRGSSLEVLKRILEKGFVFAADYKVAKRQYCILMKYFPIKMVSINRKRMCFLEGKEAEACREFIRRSKKKCLSRNEIGEIMKVFGVKRRNDEVPP